jgi:predicted  nucleic acid-binding Zn-ribbon protein
MPGTHYSNEEIMNITLTPEQVAQVAAVALKDAMTQAKRKERLHQRKLDAANERTVDWKTRAMNYRKDLLEAREEMRDLRQRIENWRQP